MTKLQRRIKQYQRMKAMIPELERSIRDEAMPILREQGLLATPRLERIIAQFAL